MSKIEWTNQTWNPIIGCSKVSEGCKNCYAEKMALRLAKIKKTKQYAHVVTNGEWNGLTSYQFKEGLNKPLKRKKPTMYFVCSMGDLFHDNVSFWWIDEVFDIIRECPQHTFQILTKRPETMQRWFNRCNSRLIPNNVWLGVTVENKEQRIRINYLLQIPAKVRFVSVEPMLSEIDLGQNLPDWVICGGESGPNARPMHPDWVRSLKDQCKTANVPFFFKQWGEWSHYNQLTEEMEGFKGGSIKKINKEYYKVGKKAAGSLLDGKEYKEFPNVKI